MRKLTIKREKRFVGCAGRMKVYIEDPSSPEIQLKISDAEGNPEQISCRKIGEIKNGEEKCFEISENAAKVFVIADLLSKDYCNDFYELPEGNEDISLSGRNILNPALGNPFRFDGNDSVAVAKNRKKSSLKGVFFIIVAAVVGLLIGYFGMMGIMSGVNSKEKTFNLGEMSITLTEGFEQQRVVGYSGVYSSREAAVFITTNPFDDGHIITDFTEVEYADRLISYNGYTDSKVESKNGLTYFIINEKTDDTSFSHYMYVYKSDEAYWVVEFVVEQSKLNKYADDIAKWAGSVKFN